MLKRIRGMGARLAGAAHSISRRRSEHTGASSARWLRYNPGALRLLGLVAGAATIWFVLHYRVTSAAADTLSSLQWPLHGNDPGNMRYQNVDQINPSNVSQLKPAWVFHTGVMDPDSSFEATPIEVNNTVYVSTGLDDVFALNAITGAMNWAYHPQSDMPPIASLSLCCGRNNRGVAYRDGLVYLGRLDDVLVALDSQTGQVRWKATVADWTQSYSITMAPQVINDMVVIGVAGGEYKVRGFIAAYDAETGAQLWKTYTTAPGTWAGNSYLTGGAPVWNAPAFDRSLGLLYIATGNAAPDIDGEARAGDNLYSASIVALNVATGAVKWHFQEVHHDIWDYDSTPPVVLFTLVKGGVSTPAIAHTGKSGDYFILDRRNGQPLYPVTEMAVPTTPAWQNPSPTQPVSTIERLTPISVIIPVPSTYNPQPRYTVPDQSYPLIQPGPDAGAEWPAHAYSPRTKFWYHETRYMPAQYYTFPGNTTGFGSTEEANLPGVVENDFGLFGATDTTTGKLAWKIRVNRPAKSGILVAGDLVFFGESSGVLRAVNAATGSNLWSFDGATIPNGGGANAAPIAYVAGTREFIVNCFGGNRNDREDLNTSPLGDAVVAFSLPRTNH